jgi:DNA polymerase-3 subunit alpha
MYGAAQFFKACDNAGIKGIIGMEIYEAVPHRWDLERDKGIMKIPFGEGNRYFHLTVWCQNLTGWQNLCAIHTASYSENYKMPNRNQALVDRYLLEQHNEGLMIGLGCMASRTNQTIMNENVDAAYESAKWYKEVFGDRVYMEVMGNLKEQIALIRPQRQIASRLGIPTIATNDVHYVHQEDGARDAAHHVLVQARMHKKAGTEKSGDRSDAGFGSWYGTDEFYLKSYNDMMATGGIAAPDLAETVALLDRVDFDFNNLAKPSPPVAPIPEPGEDPEFERFLIEHAT